MRLSLQCTLFFALFLIFALPLSAQEDRVFESSLDLQDQMEAVNAQWSHMGLAEGTLQDPLTFGNYSNRIQQHLRLVRESLLSNAPEGLNSTQLENRMRTLEILKQYAERGRFPVNIRYGTIRPCFIDHYNTHCAVGYLMKETGYAEVARKVADTDNYAYVHDMDYPELFAWADENGFTVDELAWIQPGYPPENLIAPVGGGIPGNVFNLNSDDDNNVIYVGGNFIKTCSNGTANNIAFWDGGTWFSLGDGVNGTVYSTIEYKNELYIAGDFTMSGSTMVSHLAKWDGSKWLDVAGGTDGPIKALHIYQDKLYIGGDFTKAGNLTANNIVTFDGTSFAKLSADLDGPVHSFKEFGGDLIVGGDFMGNGTNTLAHIAMYDGSNWSAMDNGLDAEVNDMEIHHGLLFAAGRITDESENRFFGMATWDGAVWDTVFSGMMFVDPDSVMLASSWTSGNLYITDIKEYRGVLVMSGRYYFMPMIGTTGFNLSQFIHDTSATSYNYIAGLASYMDGPVNTLEAWQGHIHIGGEFDSINGGPLPGIGKTDFITDIGNRPFVGMDLRLFPNPATTTVRSRIEVEYGDLPGQYEMRILDLTGKVIREWKQLGGREYDIDITGIPGGNYLVQIVSDGKQFAAQKLQIN